jgi:tRNA nucleotidyltransferase (CCA-adding enzyme)
MDENILEKCIIDPFRGVEDIQNRIIRCPVSAKKSFDQDPLRILRGIRFATTLGFEIEEHTLKKLVEQSHSLMRISRERWVEEFNKILQSDNVFNGLKMLWGYRIFNFTIPELAIQWNYDQNSRYHDLQLWEHTTRVVEEAQKGGESLNMLWAALLHDIGKCYTRTDKRVIREVGNDGFIYTNKSNYIMHERVGAEIAFRILTYMKFSNKDIKEICDLIRHHLEDESPLRKYDNMHKKEIQNGN